MGMRIASSQHHVHHFVGQRATDGSVGRGGQIQRVELPLGIVFGPGDARVLVSAERDVDRGLSHAGRQFFAEPLPGNLSPPGFGVRNTSRA